jgi:hypothetical protein
MQEVGGAGSTTPSGERRASAGAPAGAEAVPGTPKPSATSERPTDETAARKGDEPVAEAPRGSGSGGTPPSLTPAHAAVAPVGPSRAGTFLALVLGGLLAALIGAAASQYFFPHGWWTDTVELERRVTALEARPSGPDAAALEGALAPFALRLDSVEGNLATLGQRLETLEAVEPADVTALEARLAGLAERLEAAEAVDVDAIDRRLQALGARIEAAEADAPGPDLQPLERALDELAGRLDALEATRAVEIAAAAEAAVEASLEEARAAQQARVAELDAAADALAADQARLDARAALTELSVAAETGQPAPDALARLSAVADPPEALAAFADGVPTLGALQADFPAYARQALRAAPVAPGAPAGDRVLNFLRAQTGARSLAPRAGADPDAVLSRAEAAVRAGRLRDALEEIAALPPDAAAEVEPWRVRAERRQAAMEALAATQARLGPG